MGSGKGNPEYWVAVVKPGRIMFEIAGVPRERAEEALRRAAMKMPMDCRFVERFIAGADAEAIQEELMHQYEHYIDPGSSRPKLKQRPQQKRRSRARLLSPARSRPRVMSPKRVKGNESS